MENDVFLPELNHLKNFLISGWKTTTKIAIKNVRSGSKICLVSARSNCWEIKLMPKRTIIALNIKLDLVCLIKINTR